MHVCRGSSSWKRTSPNEIWAAQARAKAQSRARTAPTQTGSATTSTDRIRTPNLCCLEGCVIQAQATQHLLDGHVFLTEIITPAALGQDWPWSGFADLVSIKCFLLRPKLCVLCFGAPIKTGIGTVQGTRCNHTCPDQGWMLPAESPEMSLWSQHGLGQCWHCSDILSFALRLCSTVPWCALNRLYWYQPFSWCTLCPKNI